MAKVIHISTPYITLGQLLKLVGVIDTGGQAKWFLAEHDVLVNGQAENRRGRKLYPGDVIEIDGFGQVKIAAQS
ncbi:S4 domain protein YaaA [Caldalkalibacillus thermarum TA2.A1]|uniref:S4 domain protein YaaA n=1 Tax=Caldalkalibacillus thermarum (strain TA2.A1) TaxID=986075 RepID=F5L540_CALTT|nr:S4 domain-containing protein YaaA [Caldalkalibacillus thermarum]EGL83542.1 S4 domain protein YaaA [Caldalkalibacillus thermarum TA2.A1]QZT34300.1 S4 domain-containing protein YaaA [Caldalkalibacillus thermarum TA2.A1]